MKKLNTLVIALTLVACNTAQKDPKAELLRILELQESVYDNQTAENKRKFMETCTDSLIFIGGDDGGMMTTPLKHVNDFADGYSKKPYDKKIQIYDNTAFVTFLQQTFKILGSDTLYLNVRYTKVFVKQNEQWKMAYVTYAPLPVHYDKIVKVDPSIYSRYTGIYDLGTSGLDSVYVENGKLYSSGSELLPVNDSTFIGDGYFGKAIFGKSHYTFEWNDGQRIKFAKVR